MLSTVDFGPGRPYSHHFTGPAVSSFASTSAVLSSAAMSAAEFARPLPKPRYNNAPLRNGLSPRSKYSEQTGPVNLAVSQQTSSVTLSLADGANLTSQNQQSIDNELIPSAQQMASLYGSPKLSYCTTQVSAANFYPSMYGRTSTIYGPPSHYSGHPLTSRTSIPHQLPYIAGQLDPYATYMSPVKIVPPFVLPSAQTSPSGGISGNLPISVKPCSSLSVNDRSQQPQAPIQIHQQQHHLQHSNIEDKKGKVQSGSNAYLPLSVKNNMPPYVISSVQTSSSSSLSSATLNSVGGNNNNNNNCNNVPISMKSSTLDSNNSTTNNNNNININNNNTIMANGKTVGFKVPSGKEGSLKHRILTRPYGEKDGKCRTSIHTQVVRSSNNTSAPTNFTKGSLIELANGDLRRVEDMRTEDFILSSNKNPDLQLADTTVVKISALGQHNIVLISFSYNNNKFDMETIPEHPFFVYGQGWASCNPEGSIQIYGLKCNLLQVGDICISLTPREPTQVSAAAISHSPQPSPPSSAVASSYYHNLPYNYSNNNSNINNNNKEELVQIPQNLSRKPQTIPTTATGTAVTSRPAPHFDVNHQLLNCSTSKSKNQSIQNVVMRSMSNNDDRRSHSDQLSLSAVRPRSQDGTLLSLSQSPLSKTIPHINSVEHMTRSLSSTPPSRLPSPLNRLPLASSSANNHNHHPALPPPPTNIFQAAFENAVGAIDCSTAATADGNNGDDAVVDVSLSRKRRWSAPDNICDDENCLKTGQKNCTH